MKRVGVCSASMSDARLGRVDALAERVEVLAALVVEEDDLAVEHVAARRGTRARGSSGVSGLPLRDCR